MAKFYESINPELQAFIEKQHIFFVASAPLSAEGHVNLSPKGLDAFRVLSPNRVAYIDIISSGNETSAHTLENGRITFMFCSYEGNPLILRLFGRGKAVLPGHPEWASLAALYTVFPSTRQIITADISLVQTACGFGVPEYTYNGERDEHFKWAEKKGPEGLERYKQEHSMVSLDGLPTDLAIERKGA
jgi:hypothetical protein